MNILVLNCGSSSIKFKLINIKRSFVLCKGQIEGIGTKNKYYFSCASDLKKHEGILNADIVYNYVTAIQYIIELLTNNNYKILQSKEDIDAIGHRVVHGGEYFSSSVIINNNVIKKIKECIKLAPLHNPHNIEGIMVCRKLFPKVPQVAVFDTAFFHTLPSYAYIYGLPYKYYLKNKIRRYGFHGTSHAYVVERVAAILNKNMHDLKVISCHLGNGASIAAVRYGKAIDISMGFTPLEGLLMGTRCGDLDPAIVPFLMEEEGLSPGEIRGFLNEKCGLLGISGISNDLREIVKYADKGNKRADLALKAFIYRIRKYISSYLGVLEGADALVFTAGIGENAVNIRKMICENFKVFGIEIDNKINNNVIGRECIISKKNSKVKIFCIPTNEELFIAKETFKVIKM